MKKIFWLFLGFVSTLSIMTGCDDTESYAELRDKENLPMVQNVELTFVAKDVSGEKNGEILEKFNPDSPVNLQDAEFEFFLKTTANTFDNTDCDNMIPAYWKKSASTAQ